MPTGPAIEILWKLTYLFKVHQISSNLQNLYWNHHLKHACEIWVHSEKLKIFHEKMPTVAGYRNIMKFSHLFKVHQISSNWQNLLESSSETCMWNLSPFGEVKIFHEKMPTGPAIEILWKFHTFSKFTKFHQTYRIYWNHHLKHACEIWVHSEKLKFFMKKCRQGRL